MELLLCLGTSTASVPRAVSQPRPPGHSLPWGWAGRREEGREGGGAWNDPERTGKHALPGF